MIAFNEFELSATDVSRNFDVGDVRSGQFCDIFIISQREKIDSHRHRWAVRPCLPPTLTRRGSVIWQRTGRLVHCQAQALQNAARALQGYSFWEAPWCMGKNAVVIYLTRPLERV